MKLNSSVSKFLTNKWVLNIVSFLALFNIIGYMVMGNLNSVIYFIVLAVLVRYFSKNMIIVLGIPLVLVNLFRVSNINIEGMETESSPSTNSKILKKVIDVYPKILEYKSIEEINENVLKIKGFSDKTASLFSSNLKSFCDFLEEITSNTTYTFNFNSKKNKDKKFVDEIIVMTGFRSDEISEFIENNGGKISSSVSKNTTLVIYVENDKPQSKLVKAKELGIKMITKENFEKKYIN